MFRNDWKKNPGYLEDNMFRHVQLCIGGRPEAKLHIDAIITKVAQLLSIKKSDISINRPPISPHSDNKILSIVREMYATDIYATPKQITDIISKNLDDQYKLAKDQYDDKDDDDNRPIPQKPVKPTETEVTQAIKILKNEDKHLIFFLEIKNKKYTSYDIDSIIANALEIFNKKQKNFRLFRNYWSY